MIHSHELTYTLLADSIEEVSLSFFGSSLEMQELELVLNNTLQPQTVYQQQMKVLVDGLTNAYNGKMEFLTCLEYNTKILSLREGKEEHHEL